jgi:uroporphyrinogen decarboxylase
MTSWERVLTVLNHKKPDRTPRLLYEEALGNGYVPAIAKLLRERCGSRLPREFFDMDLTAVVLNPSRLSLERFAEWLPKEARKPDGSFDPGVTEWGEWWRTGSSFHFAHVESPLATVADFARIREYPWPDLDQPYRYEGLRQRVDALHAQGRAVTGFAGSIFEQAWYIRGITALLEDMMLNPEIAHYVLQHTADLQKRAAAEMAKAGVDIIILGDDVATQTGLMMSIPMWKTFLRDRLAATIQAAKKARRESRVFYHSDGHITPLIPHLIEAGVEVLNPLQPECVDQVAVKKEFGKQLVFFGSVSVQHTMPQGTPEQVREEVRTRIRTLGCDGGLILSPAHVLGPETPWENIVAFFEAANESCA